MAASSVHPPALADRRTVQSSELSRNSAAVFAAAEQGPVTITRRDGEGFVLARSGDVERERRALELAMRVVVSSLDQGAQPLGERLREPFPWLGFLPADGRERFAAEMVDLTRACAAVGQFSRLLVTFAAWRSTAEAIAAGYTPDGEVDWLADPVPVADPREQG